MPRWLDITITIGSWLIVQVPIGVLLGRYLRSVRRSYTRVPELREPRQQQKAAGVTSRVGRKLALSQTAHGVRNRP